MKLISAVALFLCIASLLAADFTGTYKATLEGTAYTLTLKEDGKGGVSGSLLEGDLKLALKGRVTGGAVEGTCTADGESLRFKLVRQGDKLVMTLFEEDEGEIDELGSITFNAPNAQPAKNSTSAKTTSKPSDNSPARATSGATQRLLWGTTLSLPKGWTLKTAGGETQFVPPQAKASERYISPVVGAPEGSSPSDDAFSDAIQAYVAEATAGMSIVANKVVTTKSGPGRLIAWEGNGQRMHVYATVQDGLAVGIIAAGPKASILARANDLSQMFASFSKGQAQQDSNLAGVWVSSAGEYNTDRDSYNRSNRKTTAELAPNGQYAVQSNSKTVLSGDGFHAESSSTGAVLQGRWFAANGNLVLVSQTGDPELLAYRFVNGGVQITDRNGRSEIFRRG